MRKVPVIYALRICISVVLRSLFRRDISLNVYRSLFTAIRIFLLRHAADFYTPTLLVCEKNACTKYEDGCIYVYSRFVTRYRIFLNRG